MTAEEKERHTSGNNAKTAQRVLHNFLNQTDWNEEELGKGVALEIQGDNMTSIRWLNGEWRVNNRTYAKQIAEIQDELHTLHTEYRLQGSGAGKNIGKHVYREGNERADTLTHIARTGDMEEDHSETFCEYDLFALRGAFDGGVDEEGAGAGWWLEGLVKASTSHPIFGSFAELDRKQWVLIRQKAFGLPADRSAMSAEFQALSSLCEAVSQVISNIGRRTRAKRTVAPVGG